MLFSDWTRQVLAFVAVFAFFVGTNHFGMSFGSILFEITENETVAAFAMSFLMFASFAFGIPVFYGLVGFEISSVSGKNAKLSDLFSAFSDFDKVIRSYTIFFRLLFKGVLCFLPAIALLFFKSFFYENLVQGNWHMFGIDIVLFCINTVLVLLVYFGIVMSAGSFVGIYISVKREDKQVDECFYEAKKCIKGSESELAKTALSFLPLFAVSLFTMGFLFVLYTVPYMVITLIMFSKYLYDKKTMCLQ